MTLPWRILSSSSLRQFGIAVYLESQYDHVMKTFTVKLPEPLAMRLSRRARELGCPRSEIVRDASERSRKGDASANCHELMMDVCGSVDGPKDLSTKLKYLKGFER